MHEKQYFIKDACEVLKNEPFCGKYEQQTRDTDTHTFPGSETYLIILLWLSKAAAAAGAGGRERVRNLFELMTRAECCNKISFNISFYLNLKDLVDFFFYIIQRTRVSGHILIRNLATLCCRSNKSRVTLLWPEHASHTANAEILINFTLIRLVANFSHSSPCIEHRQRVFQEKKRMSQIK